MNEHSTVEDNISDVANGGKMWDHITNPAKPSLMKDSRGHVLVHPVSGVAQNNLFGEYAVRLIALVIVYIYFIFWGGMTYTRISPFLSINVIIKTCFSDFRNNHESGWSGWFPIPRYCSFVQIT